MLSRIIRSSSTLQVLHSLVYGGWWHNHIKFCGNFCKGIPWLTIPEYNRRHKQLPFFKCLRLWFIHSYAQHTQIRRFCWVIYYIDTCLIKIGITFHYKLTIATCIIIISFSFNSSSPLSLSLSHCFLKLTISTSPLYYNYIPIFPPLTNFKGHFEPRNEYYNPTTLHHGCFSVSSQNIASWR